jgi:hypothetical protein
MLLIHTWMVALSFELCSDELSILKAPRVNWDHSRYINTANNFVAVEHRTKLLHIKWFTPSTQRSRRNKIKLVPILRVPQSGEEMIIIFHQLYQVQLLLGRSVLHKHSHIGFSICSAVVRSSTWIRESSFRLRDWESWKRTILFKISVHQSPHQIRE